MKIDWKVVSLILTILILVGGSVRAYSYIYDKGYFEGIADTTLIINQQILNSLNQNGYIPYMYPINETSSIQIKLIPQFQNG